MKFQLLRFKFQTACAAVDAYNIVDDAIAALPSFGEVAAFAKQTVRMLPRIAGMVVLATIVTVAPFLMVACGPPSKKTIARLHAGALVVFNTVEINETLPDQLLAEKILNLDQYGLMKAIIAEVKSGAARLEQGLAVALTLEKPSLKSLAPIVADILRQLRALNSLVANEMVQKFFAAAEIGLRVLGSYFALQISSIRDELKRLRDADVRITEDRIFVAGHGDYPAEDAGRLQALLRSSDPTDEDVCRAVGLDYNKTRFDLLAYAYDGSRFEEYAREAERVAMNLPRAVPALAA